MRIMIIRIIFMVLLLNLYDLIPFNHYGCKNFGYYLLLHQNINLIYINILKYILI